MNQAESQQNDGTDNSGFDLSEVIESSSEHGKGGGLPKQSTCRHTVHPFARWFMKTTLTMCLGAILFGLLLDNFVDNLWSQAWQGLTGKVLVITQGNGKNAIPVNPTGEEGMTLDWIRDKKDFMNKILVYNLKKRQSLVISRDMYRGQLRGMVNTSGKPATNKSLVKRLQDKILATDKAVKEYDVKIVKYEALKDKLLSWENKRVLEGSFPTNGKLDSLVNEIEDTVMANEFLKSARIPDEAYLEELKKVAGVPSTHTSQPGNPAASNGNDTQAPETKLRKDLPPDSIFR